MVDSTRSSLTVAHISATQSNQEEPTTNGKATFWKRFSTSKIVKLICYIVNLLFTPCSSRNLKSRDVKVVKAKASPINKHPSLPPSDSFLAAQDSKSHIGELQGITQISINPANSMVSVPPLGSQASHFFSSQDDDNFASELQPNSLSSEDTLTLLNAKPIFNIQDSEDYTDLQQQDTTHKSSLSLGSTVSYQTFARSLYNRKFSNFASDDEDHIDKQRGAIPTTSSPIDSEPSPNNTFIPLSLDYLESQIYTASQDDNEDHIGEQQNTVQIAARPVTPNSSINTFLSLSLSSLLESQGSTTNQDDANCANKLQQAPLSAEDTSTFADSFNIYKIQSGEGHTDALEQDATQDSKILVTSLATSTNSQISTAAPDSTIVVKSLSTSTDSLISTDALSLVDSPASPVDIPPFSLLELQASTDSKRITPVTLQNPNELTSAQNSKISDHLNALFQSPPSSPSGEACAKENSLLEQLQQSSERGFDLLQNIFQKTLTSGSAQSAADIANYLFLIATLNNQPFTDGSYMVQDKDNPENIKLLFNFLKTCGAYTRKSSHLHTQSDTTQHFGIDTPEELFPRHHYHLLFFEVDGGKLFIKPEHAGLNGITDIVTHSWEWLMSAAQRVMNYSQEDTQSVIWRKERPSYLPAEDKQLLVDFIMLLQTPTTSATNPLDDTSEGWSNISMPPVVNEEEIQRMVQEITNNGISALVGLTKKLSDRIKTNPQLVTELTAIVKKFEAKYPQVEDRMAREVVINFHQLAVV